MTAARQGIAARPTHLLKALPILVEKHAVGHSNSNSNSNSNSSTCGDGCMNEMILTLFVMLLFLVDVAAGETSTGR
jgi:hypothetical protein